MKKRNILLFCISVISFITCEKKNGALNRKDEFFDKLTVNSLLFSTATPDNLLTTTLIDNLHFYTDSARTVLLGNDNHPILSDTKTSFYTSLHLTSQLTEKIAKSTIDSVRLYLAYSADTIIYGVPPKNKAEIKLDIFSLKEKLKPVTEKRYSYTDKIDIDPATPLSWLENDKSIVLNPKDSVEITLKGEKKKYPPTLIVPIKKELGQKIFDAAKDPAKPITPDILSDLLKGFVFQANNNSGIATLNIQNPLSVLRIFYKDEKGDQNYYNLSLYNPNTKIRYFTNVSRKKASDLNNVGAFQGSGLGMKVDISALKKEAELTKKVINQAVLYIYLQDKTPEERPILLASILGAYSLKKTDATNATETFSLIFFPGYLPFLSNYNKEKNRYELYMTAYIQAYLSGEKMDDELFFFPNILSAYSSIFDLQKMELKITYSDFKQ